MKTLSRAEVLELASALFNASNALTIGWQGWNDDNINPEIREREQAGIEAAQDKVQGAIKLLGGVDYLVSIGA